MQNLQTFKAVAERDIDLLLIEELHVTASFRSWLLDYAFEGRDPSGQFLGAWHSVSHPTLGESDIVILFEDFQDNKAALLIENKIDAPAQPEQPERYRLRGGAGIEDGSWHKFRTCIMAPKAYMEARVHAESYDICISYESIRDWFQQWGSDARSAYRARLMQEAIDQSRRGYSPDPHSGVTQFWFDYWELARVEYPELHMRKPGKIPAGSDWPMFRPGVLGQGRRIVHKLARGVVDLEIDGAAGVVEEIVALNRNVLGDQIAVMRTNKSASIRIEVTILDRFAGMPSQLVAARAGLSAASRLLTFADVHDPAMQVVLAQSPRLGNR